MARPFHPRFFRRRCENRLSTPPPRLSALLPSLLVAASLLPRFSVAPPQFPAFQGPTPGVLREVSIPTVDLSGDTHRQVVIARGTPTEYHGHCDTVLTADGRTLFAASCMNHAGYLGPLSRSDDGGRTWSAPLPTPANWKEVTAPRPSCTASRTLKASSASLCSLDVIFGLVPSGNRGMYTGGSIGLAMLHRDDLQVCTDRDTYSHVRYISRDLTCL